MSQKIKPLGDRALVKPMSSEEMGTKSPSGIIIPETVDKKTDRGTVIAVGEGRRNDKGELVPMSVKEGDKVLFQWGEKVEVNREEYYLVSESNILATIS